MIQQLLPADPHAQHVVNTAVVIAPAASLMAQLPTIITVITGILAGIYYCLLISDWVRKNWRRNDEGQNKG